MPLTQAELEPLLRLALVQGVGPNRMARIIERFGSAERALRAPLAELLNVDGIGPELARRVHAAGSVGAIRAVRAALRRLAELDAMAILPTDPLYPEPFRHLSEPPFLLFAAGDPELLGHPALAIVGTRAPTHYGRRAAKGLSGELALAGYVIVSGMARGIDAAAHVGALDVGGRTIGVLGHGIEQVYPPENQTLFARVRAHGLLLTEYPPGETPKAGNFPRRNRLITSLAEAVVVVEMGHQSGAQHTVNYALEQGKEVFAVPGPIGAPASMGTNQLIRDGAPIVTSVDDILEPLRGVGSGPRRGGNEDRGTPASSRSEPESRLLQALSLDPIHVDDLASRVGMTTSDALALLLQLELRGSVAVLPGMRYALP